MDLVYICRSGDNEELRYSIRSMVANVPHDNLWVVGGKPSWYIGKHIPVKQSDDKYDNARNNLKAIVESSEISDRFILANDDFYVTKPIKKIYTFVSGTLNAKLTFFQDKHPSSFYTSLIRSTYSKIKQIRGKSFVSMDYDIHVPMVFEKKKLAPLLEYILLWRSLYGNKYSLPYKVMRDVKIYRHNKQDALEDILNRDTPYMSSDDTSFKYIYDMYLAETFNVPSPYEAI